MKRLLTTVTLKPRLYSFLLIITLIWSCSKDSNNTNKTHGTFQYKVNGGSVSMDVASALFLNFEKHLAPDVFCPQTCYMCIAKAGFNDGITFTIVSDSLHVGNYFYDNTHVPFLSMAYNGQNSELAFPGDSLSINITSYANAYISGNFTAKLSPVGINGYPDYSNRGTTIITDGFF